MKVINNINQTNRFISSVRELNEGMDRKYFVFTFGCQQNEADSERIRGMLREMGYSPAAAADDADIIIVNTCAIREHAEMKALSLLGSFKAYKRQRPELIVGIAGCMAAEEHIANKLKNDFHYVSFTVEPNMLVRIPELVYRSAVMGKRSFILGEDKGDIYEGLPIERALGHRAWVTVMYGCNNFCSYCIVPYVRGRERSRRSEDIILECRRLVSNGVKEITLLGQNVNSYRSDMDFAELISAIAEIKGDFIIRFMTSHPKDTSAALISAMKKYNGKIAPYFHLPLQSGSDRILKAMNRTYTKERYLSIARDLRNAVPAVALSTDVIVGFPGEDEEDFAETLKVLEEVRFDNVYAFIYSSRAGTRAAEMEGAVPRELASARLSRLLEIQDVIALERNLPYNNKTVRILVDSVEQRGGNIVYTGRTDTNKPVHFTGNNVKIGEFANVKIEKVGAYDLIGSVINN